MKNETYQDLEPDYNKIEELMRNQPLIILNYDVELVAELSASYIKGDINQNMLRNAVDKGEITLKEYVKIINQNK